METKPHVMAFQILNFEITATKKQAGAMIHQGKIRESEQLKTAINNIVIIGFIATWFFYVVGLNLMAKWILSE